MNFSVFNVYKLQQYKKLNYVIVSSISRELNVDIVKK